MLTPHEFSALLCIARSPEDVDVADPEFVSLVEMGLAMTTVRGQPVARGPLLTSRGHELLERIVCTKSAAVQRM